MTASLSPSPAKWTKVRTRVQTWTQVLQVCYQVTCSKQFRQQPQQQQLLLLLFNF